MNTELENNLVAGISSNEKTIFESWCTNLESSCKSLAEYELYTKGIIEKYPIESKLKP